MSTDEFFGKVRPWSRRKHRLLSKYIRPFSAKVATISPTREIFVVDGFAGAARYDDGSAGSPLLIAKLSDECSKWDRPAKLKLINVEPDPHNEGIFRSLREATAEWEKLGTVTNLNLGFRNAVPEILNIIGEAPSLFFVDPFGPTYLHFDDLLPILNRRQSATELIINFDQDGLRRIVNTTRSDKMDPKAAETNEQNVTRVLGSSNWKNRIVDKNLNSTDEEQILLDEYLTNISKFGYTVVGYPIRESLTAKAKYFFVYCTRHPDGLNLMNDFMRDEEDSIHEEHVDTNLPLFIAEASRDNFVSVRRKVLRELIESLKLSNRTFSRGEVKARLIREHFGEFHTRDYNAVIQDLLSEGRISEVNGKKRMNDNDRLSWA